MKVLSTALKIAAAVAAVGAAIYVVIAYGDKIVSWVRKLFSCAQTKGCCEEEVVEVVEDDTEEAPAEEAAAEETPAEEAPVEEAPTAEETDFAN